ncbi:MAG: hypothetical protein QOJ35_1551 [Solirubrobacteraceae bacterium]|jgi:hypothetical protein|nr:hypothetical protein [Solirubrobacteraceae bacterium]
MYAPDTIAADADLKVATAKLENTVEALLNVIGHTTEQRIRFLTLVDLSSQPAERQFAVNALAAASALVEVVTVNVAQVDTIAIRAEG